MAGATLRVDSRIDDDDVRAALERLVALGADATPAFREIGEYLDLAHRLRWDKEQAPDGTGWEPLSEVTLKRKRGRGQILVNSGNLRDLLRYEASADGLAFGTDRIYGAVQQFGAKQGAFGKTQRGGPIPWGDIPARPWLGLSEEDKQEVMAILKRHAEQAMR